MEHHQTPATPVLFFDADDTLYTLREHPGSSYVRLAASCGIALDESSIKQRVSDVWYSMEARYYRYPFGGYTSDEEEQSFWFYFVSRVLAPYCSAVMVRQVFPLIYHYFTSSESRILNADLAYAIDVLVEEGYRVGVLSNCDHRIVSIIASLLPSISPEDIYTAGRIGAKKPSVVPFDRMAARYGNRLWYIGNTVSIDMIPACRAGWQGVLLAKNPPPTEDIYWIQSGRDLLPLLTYIASGCDAPR